MNLKDEMTRLWNEWLKTPDGSAYEAGRAATADAYRAACERYGAWLSPPRGPDPGRREGPLC
jgi:hypothetical protein